MTELVCKPTPGEGVVRGRGLYSVFMNKADLGLRVRAKNAADADRMIQTCFRHELSGKTLDYDINTFKENDNGEEDEEGKGRKSVEEGGQEG